SRKHGVLLKLLDLVTSANGWGPEIDLKILEETLLRLGWDEVDETTKQKVISILKSASFFPLIWTAVENWEKNAPMVGIQSVQPKEWPKYQEQPFFTVELMNEFANQIVTRFYVSPLLKPSSEDGINHPMDKKRDIYKKFLTELIKQNPKD